MRGFAGAKHRACAPLTSGRAARRHQLVAWGINAGIGPVVTMRVVGLATMAITIPLLLLRPSIRNA